MRGSETSASVSESGAKGVGTEAAKIRVVSFDLDDTLWPTGDVVHTANAEMQRWLNEKYPGTPTAKDIQDIMRVIRKTRAEAAIAAGRPKAPVSYTELRKAGLAQAVMDAGFSEQDAREGSEEGFNVWLAARNKASDELLFDGARETLVQIREEHPHLIVGAITNGRGDVNLIPRLKGLFDFSVSGEEPKVFPARKPSLDIYREATRRAARLRDAGSEKAEDVVAREAEGWLHVGDDLANDVAPAKALGMRTVWVEQEDEGWRASFSTMSPEEDAARKALAQSSSPDFTISSVTSLPEIISSLV